MPEKVSITKLREKEGRGKFLTTMLVFNAAVHIDVIVTMLLGFIFLFTRILPYEQGAILYTMELLMYLGLLIGIWKWKKIAVYGFFALKIIDVIIATVDPSFFVKNDYPINYINIIVLLLLLWAIKSKWHLFS